MKEAFSYIEIYQSRLLQQTLRRLFGEEPAEVIHRSASHILKRVHEPEETVTRILLLPPGGYTANTPAEMNSHPEVRYAKITVKGGIDPRKAGYSQVRQAIKVASYVSRDIPTEGPEPYARVDPAHPYYREQLKSAKETFFVVRENGEGFYHNLTNLTTRWMVLILEKFLTQRREMNFAGKLDRLPASDQAVFRCLIETITEKGDRIFKENADLVNQVAGLPPEQVLPGLIEGLNFQETGNHEPCSVYAVILKISRQQPGQALDYLEKARLARDAPLYYLDELIRKVRLFGQAPTP